MTAYEFQSILHGNLHTMLDDVAQVWLSGDGVWDRQEMRESLAHESDEKLAADCIYGWGLDAVPHEDGAQSHMEQNGYTADDLAAAFARLREKLAE